MKKVLFILLITFSACKSDFSVRNASIKEAIGKNFSGTFSGIRIDSLILTKVDTLNNKQNAFMDYLSWNKYVKKRSFADSIEFLNFKLKIKSHEDSNQINKLLSQPPDDNGSIKSEASELLVKQRKTLFYLKFVDSLYKSAKNKIKDHADLGFLVSYKLLYTDSKNVQNNITSLIRVSHSFSIINTTIPDDLNSY